MSVNKAHFIDKLRISAEKDAAACNALLKDRKVEQAAALAATNEFIEFNTDFNFYYACPDKIHEAGECAYPGEVVIIPQGRRRFFPNLKEEKDEELELERFFGRFYAPRYDQS